MAHNSDEKSTEEVFEGGVCPECKEGTLVKRKGPYGEFLGCSNFKESNCRFIKKIKK